MTTLAKVAVGGVVALALLTVYSNHHTSKPAPAPVAEVDLRAPAWRGWKLEPVKPAPAPLPVAPVVLPPVAQPIQRPAHDPAPARKRAKPPIVAKHVQVKPPAPVVLPPPPPPPAPATWSDTLFGHAVDRTDER